MRSGLAVFAFLLFGAAAAAAHWYSLRERGNAELPATARNDRPLAKEANNRPVIDAQGRRVIEYRWPLGTPDHIVKLRIPVGYSWFGGAGLAAALGPDYPDPNVVGAYTSAIVIQALMPDFAPKTADNSALFDSGVNEQVVLVSLGTNVRSKHSGEAIINKLLDHFVSLATSSAKQNKDGLSFGRKSDRWNLSRVGPIGIFDNFRKIGSVEDIYFPDREIKDMFLVCGAEEIRDVTEDPAWPRKPICQHYFYSRRLQATVELNYRRVYALEWRSVQDRAEEMFASFEIIP
ncbi:MAG: hypothetical protein JO048_17600 [Methylobacteriaceae bacterium]|nr:hypothetical protein [Methylobacteriaceae bacterium]